MKDLRKEEQIYRIAVYPEDMTFYLIEKIANKTKRNMIIISNNYVSDKIAARLFGFTFIYVGFDGESDALKTIEQTSYSRTRSGIVCYSGTSSAIRLAILKKECVNSVIVSDKRKYNELKHYRCLNAEDFLKNERD